MSELFEKMARLQLNFQLRALGLPEGGTLRDACTIAITSAFDVTQVIARIDRDDVVAIAAEALERIERGEGRRKPRVEQ